MVRDNGSFELKRKSAKRFLGFRFSNVNISFSYSMILNSASSIGLGNVEKIQYHDILDQILRRYCRVDHWCFHKIFTQ